MRTVSLLVCVLIVLCLSTFSATRNQSSDSARPNAQAPTSDPAPSPRADVPSDAVAHLHVYRQRRYAGSALAPSIAIDGTQIARVGSGRRVTIRLKPGPHSIGSDDKSSAITLDVKSGQDYYIRVDEQPGFWKFRGRLTLLLPEQGSAEYKLQKPIEPERALKKDMIEDEK